MNIIHRRPKNLNRQCGFVLLPVLVVIMVLSIVAISLLGDVKTNEVISRNESNTQRAFHVAETALSKGESWLNVQPGYPAPNSSDSCITNSNCWDTNVWPTIAEWSEVIPPITHDRLLAAGWWVDYGHQTDYILDQTVGTTTLQTQYVLQERNFISDDLSFNANAQKKGIVFYTVSAQGISDDSISRSVLQSIYAKRFK
jgi:Tfp pilus assembly protein PilX